MKFSTVPTYTQATGAPGNVLPYAACFPMPGINGSVAPMSLTPFPISMPLADAVEFYWRIKQFTATFGNEFLPGNRTIVLERQNGSIHTDEKQLLYTELPFQAGHIPVMWAGVHDESSGGQTKTIHVTVRMFCKDGILPTNLGTTIGRNETAYYIFHHETEVATIIPAMEITIAVSWDRGTEYGASGDTAMEESEADIYLTVPLHNKSLTMAFYENFEAENNSLSIVASEWFPWAKDGINPTWDSATGARL